MIIAAFLLLDLLVCFALVFLLMPSRTSTGGHRGWY